MTGPLLAKSNGETLFEHTQRCVHAAKAILDGLPFTPDVRRRLEQELIPAVILHDVGKAAAGFQAMLRGEKKTWDGKRHEVLSTAVASGLSTISDASLFAILTHHRAIPPDHVGPMGGCLPPEQLPVRSRTTPVWREMLEDWQKHHDLAVAFLREAWRDAGLEGDPQCETSDQLRLDAHWLERGVNGQRARFSSEERRDASLIRGLLIAADHLASAHRVPRPIPVLTNHRIREDCRGFQRLAAGTDGSAFMRAPTGAGKTDAAVGWIAKNQRPNGRVFYVLPYTASIDAMHRRLSGVYGTDNVGILHSRAAASLYQFLEDENPWRRQSAAAMLRNLASEIWFPIRVSTPHQLLHWLLRGKGWELMLVEFHNACFVFDEVHAYEPQIVGLLAAAVQMLRQWGARFLFVSATLPAFLERILHEVAGPLAPIEPDARDERDRMILDRKRHHLRVESGDCLSRMDDLVRPAIRLSGSVLIVCNHVRSARRIYDQVRQECADVVLLHSRFSREDRLRIEKTLVDGLPRVLVSTQVVEVSLDIDFDRAFIEPAPIDALIQRMGRVNRNREPTSPAAPIVVFERQIGSVNLYCGCQPGMHSSDCRVVRSLDALYALENPLAEADLVEAANDVYRDGFFGEDAEAFQLGRTHRELLDFDEMLVAGAHRDWVDDVMSARGASIDILPSCMVSEYERRMDDGLWIEAEALLVPVRSINVRAAGGRFDRSRDLWIVDRPYDRETGLEL